MAIVGQAMISSALDVERGQIHPARTRRAEEEVADIIDKLQIDFLSLLGGAALEQRFDHPGVIGQQIGIEKRIAQPETSIACGIVVDQRQST